MNSQAFSHSLDAALYWRGVQSHSIDLARRLQAVRVPYQKGNERIPLVLAFDLYDFLLEGSRVVFSSARNLAHWPKNERVLRLHYEDRILNKWANDPSLHQAHVLLAGSAEQKNARAEQSDKHQKIGHALALGLRRFNAAELTAYHPAHFKSSGTKNGNLPFASITVDEDVKDQVRRDLELCTAQVDDEPLFSEEDLWELQTLDDIPSEAMRMALRQLHVLVGGFSPLSPRAVAAAQKRARKNTDTDEGNAAAGGFSALTHKGRLENLARGELVFLGESASDGIDLFDLRFIENELLYYTRDQSPALGRRVSYRVVIERPGDFQKKSREEDAQALITSLALTRVLHRAAQEHFGAVNVRGALYFRCHDAEDRTAANESIALLKESFRGEHAHGRFQSHCLSEGQTLPKTNASTLLITQSTKQHSDDDGLVLRYRAPYWHHQEQAFLSTQTQTSAKGADVCGLDALLKMLFGEVFFARSTKPRS